MKHLTLTICLLLTALVATSAATASPVARDPRVPALQRQVQTLQHQLGTVTQAVLRDEDIATCRWAYQSHINFGFLNLFAAMLGASPYQDTTPSDNGACQRVGMNPPRRTFQASSPFAQLDAWVTLATMPR